MASKPEVSQAKHSRPWARSSPCLAATIAEPSHQAKTRSRSQGSPQRNSVVRQGSAAGPDLRRSRPSKVAIMGAADGSIIATIIIAHIIPTAMTVSGRQNALVGIMSTTQGWPMSRVIQPTNAQPAAPTRASNDTSLARSSAMRRKLASSAAVGEWGEIAVLARTRQLMPWSATDRLSLRANRAGKPGLMASGWPLISIGPPPCPSTCVILVLPTRPLPVSATDRFAERIS